MLSPDGHALGLEVAPPLVHLLEPPGEDRGVLLGVQAADQLLARAVQAEVHVAVLLNLILEVLEQNQNHFKITSAFHLKSNFVFWE